MAGRAGSTNDVVRCAAIARDDLPSLSSQRFDVEPDSPRRTVSRSGHGPEPGRAGALRPAPAQRRGERPAVLGQACHLGVKPLELLSQDFALGVLPLDSLPQGFDLLALAAELWSKVGDGMIRRRRGFRFRRPECRR